MNQLSNAPQTLAWEPLDSLHILACQRVAVSKVLHLLPEKYITALQNAPEACCREVANLEVEAWYSGPADQAKGVPDIYKFHCTCGRCHVRFCVGGSTDPVTKQVTHPRPFWEVR